MAKKGKEKTITEVLPPTRLAYYQQNPAAFVENIIFNEQWDRLGGDKTITPQQRQILDAVANNKRVAVKAGRGIGKTAVYAWLIEWFQSCFSRARVAIFAPSFPQLNSVLWPEVNKWLMSSLVNNYFEHTATKMYLKEDRKNNFSEPRSAAKEESALGLHEDHLLILIDEAPGVEDFIYRNLQGSLTGKNNKIVIVGNPTRTSGFFFDAHNRHKRFWKRFTFSSEHSPIVDKEYLQSMKDKYTTPTYIHDMYKVHILGEFPSGDPDAFIKLEDVDTAKYREVPPVGAIEIGVDVARKGDDLTVVCVRQGFHVFSGEELGIYKEDPTTDVRHLVTMGQTSKIPEIESFVYDVVKRVRAITGYEDVIRVKTDDTGVGGGLTDYLELDEEHNLEVIPIVFSTKSDGTYADVPSKIWGTIKENIGKMSIPNDPQLIEELSTRRWDTDRSMIKIEPKTKFKKDFGASPDKADALGLCFADLENEHRIIKGYDHRNTENHGISSYLLQSGTRYCCIYATPDQKTSAVWVSWHGGEIRIIDEFVGDTADILEIIQYNGFCTKIIGNDYMFSKKGDDMYMYFMDHGMYLQESFGYNELASINNLATIAKDGHLVVAEECNITSNQLRRWTAERTRGQDRASYGLCYALTLVVSELITTNQIVNMPSINGMSYAASPINSSANINSGFMSV